MNPTYQPPAQQLHWAIFYPLILIVGCAGVFLLITITMVVILMVSGSTLESQLGTIMLNFGAFALIISPAIIVAAGHTYRVRERRRF